MRIRTQLFLGTALLAASLIAIQWWIQRRQLEAIDAELSQVATTVGRFFFQTEGGGLATVEVAAGGGGDASRLDVEAHTLGEGDEGASLLAEPEGDDDQEGAQPSPEGSAGPEEPEEPEGGGAPRAGGARRRYKVVTAQRTDERIIRRERRLAEGERLWVGKGDDDGGGDEGPGDLDELRIPGADGPLDVRLSAVTQGGEERSVLLVDGLPGGQREIPLERARGRVVEATLRESLLATSLLLLAGLLGAAIFSDRVTRPLRQLAAGAEAVSRGELGTRVEVAASGEIAELVAAFNRMSEQLAELEAQRQRWRAREHLAELGDLSRGLAHTLRNPLHTLGLAVEELSGEPGEAGPELVATVRAQIARIDRWLRSFLALGAGEAAAAQALDLRELCEALALEGAGGPTPVDVAAPGAPVLVRGVAPALMAALSNLVANAVEASPPGAVVDLGLATEGGWAVVTVADRGPGLPEAVRARLFSPHVTTKAAGSGMGIYLARQLIEGGHGGQLSFADRDGGGTVAAARIPLTPRPAVEAL